jgi:hypothetical protein
MPHQNLCDVSVFLDLEADVDWDNPEEDEVDDLGM